MSLQQEAKQSERTVSDLLVRILADRYHPKGSADPSFIDPRYMPLREVDLSSLDLLPQINIKSS